MTTPSGAADARQDICLNCGRPFANQNDYIVGTLEGKCPTRYAPRCPDAERDCKSAADKLDTIQRGCLKGLRKPAAPPVPAPPATEGKELPDAPGVWFWSDDKSVYLVFQDAPGERLAFAQLSPTGSWIQGGYVDELCCGNWHRAIPASELSQLREDLAEALAALKNEEGLARHNYVSLKAARDEATAAQARLAEVEGAMNKIWTATNVPEHKRNDTQFLRAAASIAHSFADAALASQEGSG